jgi:truncated hemoglobin YjbI
MTPYEAIGGEGPVRAVLQALYEQLFVDPIVGFLFEGRDRERIVEAQVAFTCGFLGGPQRYTGRALPEAHAHLPLLAGHFDRRHWLLSQTLRAQGVPDEVRSAWLRIDRSLRSSVLAAGEQARERTREPGGSPQD